MKNDITKKIIELKREIKRIKEDVSKGKIKPTDIDIEELTEKAKVIVNKKTIYEGTRISDDISELFGLKITGISSWITKPRIFITLTLPIPFPTGIKDIELKNKTEEEKKQIERVKIELSPGRRPPNLTIINYSIEEEKDKLLNELNKTGEIDLNEWLAHSVDAEEYIVRIIVLGIMLREGYVIISGDKKIKKPNLEINQLRI